MATFLSIIAGILGRLTEYIADHAVSKPSLTTDY